MSDDLEAQLQAFGATLESHTGESITNGSPVIASSASRPSRRWWAIAGAAASVVAVVVGLVALSGRDAEAPAVQPAVPASTSVPILPIDPDVLRTAPIAELATACNPSDVLVSTEYDATGASAGAAFSIALGGIAEHTSPGDEILPAEGWREVAGEPITVRYLDRGRGIEGIVRLRHEGDEWRVAELAQCVPGRVPSVIQTTTVAPAATTPADDAVDDDPLGLERDGWSLVQRDVGVFSMSSEEIPCDVADVLEQLNGVDEVHDIMTPLDGTGLDLDIHILDIGSLDRGLQLADFVAVIGRCIGETQGIDVETGAMSSIRASWFRAGPDFALMAVVGEGPRSIVIEIEGAPFGDDLIGDLAHRANQFLRGEPIAGTANGDGVGSDAVRPEIPRRQMTVAEAAQFADDDTRGLVCDERGRGGANWDYGPIGPADPTGRMPVDAFWEAIDQNVEEMESEGGVPYPTNGWTELMHDENTSLFVLELEGQPKATIEVGGDAGSGVWRVLRSSACQSIFIP